MRHCKTDAELNSADRAGSKQIQDCVWSLRHQSEQHTRRALGCAIAALPMPERTDTDPKGLCKLDLRHTDLSPDRFDIERRKVVHNGLGRTALSECDRLFHTTLNLIENMRRR